MNATRHDRNVVMNPPTRGPDRGGDGRRRADHRVHALLLLTREVAVDQRLHRREQQRRADAADQRPEDDHRGALRERHRGGADRVPEQAEDVRALASDEVADLAPDEDERRRHERFERNGRRTSLTVVSRSCTTAEIDTFMNDVSTTSTNMAIDRRIARRLLPDVGSVDAFDGSPEVKRR